MNKRRLGIGAVVLLLVLLGIALAVPNSRLMVQGLVQRENFFDGKPTAYWRQALREEAAKEDRSTQPIAAALLHGGPEVVPVLTDLLQDDDPKVRSVAASLLPAHFAGKPPEGSEAAVGPLTAALKDEDKNVRAKAAQVLGCIGAPARDAVHDLAALLADPDPTVAYHAARALTEIGPDARPAVPALLKACNDSRAPVRGGARMAVRAIAPEAAVKAGIPLEDDPPPPHQPTLKGRPPRR